MELTWQHFLKLPRTRESILMWSACLSWREKNFKIQKTERKNVITFLSCNLHRHPTACFAAETYHLWYILPTSVYITIITFFLIEFYSYSSLLFQFKTIDWSYTFCFYYQALINATSSESSLEDETAVSTVALFDHDEVGSDSAQGAGSPAMQ